MGLLIEYRRTTMRRQSTTGHANTHIVWSGLRVLVMTAFVMSLAHPCLLQAASTAKDFHQAALKALQGGDTGKAVELLTKALELNPKEYRYYNDRGIAYRRAGNLESALADYTKVLELKSNYTNALNNRGIVHLQLGRYDKAVADFTEALKHGGLEGKIYTNRGMARAAKGDHKGAIEDFEKALSFPPVDTRSFLLMAKSLEEAGVRDKALKMYQLAKGLAKDRDTAAHIEERITALDRAGGRPATRRSGSDTGNSRAKPSVGAQSARKTAQSRTVLPAPPPPRVGTASPPETSQPAHDTRVESLKDLNGQVRKKAGEKYSATAREIFRQGLQFLERSDANKALVRFEDSRQLERRQKNYYAVAWSDLEIGRAYAALHEYLKAVPYLEEALRLFERLKAEDEVILTLVELSGVTKSVGRADRSAELFKAAIEKAAARGHYTLSRIIADVAAGRPIRTTVSRDNEGQASGSSSGGPRGPEKTAAAGSEGTTGLADEPHRAGRKAFRWGNKETVTTARRKTAVNETRPPAVRKTDEESRSARITLWTKSPSSSKDSLLRKNEGASRQKIPSPEVLVGTAPGAGLRQTASGKPHSSGPVAAPLAGSLQADLQILRGLKEKNAELEMIAVLERLAQKYEQKRDYDKALHSMTASLALREKLPVGKGHDRALERAAGIKEQLGRTAEALEDMTRALALARAKRERTERELEARSKKLAAALGLDPVKTVAAFEKLWQARNSGRSHEETEALHAVAGLFEAANRPTEALKYFDLSAASMLVDKSRVYRKAGKTQDADRLHEQALQAFRELDYSRYMQMMRQADVANAAARR